MQLADGFARVVRDAPDERLERIMRTRMRRAVLDGIFWQMPQHVNRKAIAGADAVIRWEVTNAARGPDTYELTLKDGRCSSRRGATDIQPTVTVTLDAVELVKLATGNSDPMQAYFKGRLKLGGDIMFAAKLQVLFRIPGALRRQASSTVSSSQ